MKTAGTDTDASDSTIELTGMGRDVSTGKLSVVGVKDAGASPSVVAATEVSLRMEVVAESRAVEGGGSKLLCAAAVVAGAGVLTDEKVAGGFDCAAV